MKRQAVLRNVIKSLEDNDVVLFQGEQLCREAYKYKKEGFLFLTEGNAVAIGIGIANATNKKVFVVIEDNFALNNLDILLQAAASKCTNLFIIMIISGCYNENSSMPNIIYRIANKSGLFFNMGFIVHNHTKLLSRNDYNELNAIWSTAKGPLMAFNEVTPGANKNVPELYFNFEESLNSFSDFVVNKALGTSMSDVPIYAYEIDLPLEEN